MSTRDVVNYAIALTRRGYACFPVNVYLDERGKKRPKFKSRMEGDQLIGWELGEYPTEPDEIEAHWNGYTGIAINTERSRIVLVDIDVKGDVDGFANLREAGIELPDTPVAVRTPSGGMHLFYRVGATAVESSQGKLVKGVDIRAIGGVGFAPPTGIEGGGSYEFVDPTAMVRPEELPEFPAEIAELLKPRETKIHTSKERPILTMDQRLKMQRRMDRIMRDLSSMEDGSRNATMRLRLIRLFGMAMTLGEDLEAVAQLTRDAYFESGGSAEHELESFIEWAQKHAQYESPEGDTDESFEAEVAKIMRDAKIREEAKQRLSPIRVTQVSDNDILEFDPAALAGDWWLEGLVPKDETVIVFGPPNAGKSFAAVDLAMGMALGTEAWGRKVSQGKVLYLAGEGTRRISLRRKVWELFHESAPTADQIQFRKMRLLLSSDESVAQHQDMVKQLQPDLIVVDTMIRAAEGLALDNPGEASRIIAQLDRVREVRPGATVVVLHHPPESNLDKPAGAYPIRGNVDTILKLTDEGGIRKMSVTKSREGDTSLNASFELRSILVPGTDLSSAVFVPAVRHSPFD